jgi:hypothetical protein
MKTKEYLYVGRVISSNECGDFEVLEYKSSRNVKVKFKGTGYTTTAQAGDIVRGRVKDKLKPRLNSPGFIGVGKYASRNDDGEISAAYTSWVGMLDRCYNIKLSDKYHTYTDCVVCDEWHDFQNFAKWHEENYFDGGQIDKDIKFNGNKLYSPETCIMANQKDNKVAAHARHYVITTPDKKTIEIFNLSEFCRSNGLTPSLLSKTITGERSHHKGFSAKRATK